MSTSVVDKFKKVSSVCRELLNGPSEDEIKEKEAIVTQTYRLERLKMNDDFTKGYIPLLEEIKRELEKLYLSPGIDKEISERARLQASTILLIEERVKKRIQEGVAASTFLEKQEKTDVG